MVRQARRRRGLTQRELAQEAAVSQSTVARIESGTMDPRASTLQKLLRACGEDLEAQPLMGVGIDRSLIRAALERSPRERIQMAADMSHFVDRLRRGLRKADDI